MKKYATAFLRKVSVFLEMFISLMLAVGITLLAIKLAFSLRNIPYLDIYPNYEDLLETCFNLIIGVELIRMLYQHRPSTVFEVLLFAIARQIIIDHANPLNSLIGVIAIAILFATRKFLFSEFEESEKVIFRATSKVRHVNSIIHVHIPYHDDQLTDSCFFKFHSFFFRNYFSTSKHCYIFQHSFSSVSKCWGFYSYNI